MINKIITVKNAEGDPDTKAEIAIQNQIDFEPKVSVIIPVYNVEEYLRQCLDSVVNQTLKEIEIICVDDGSTDSSLEILKEYASKDKRITVIKQENLHAGVARNAGLAVARGSYIGFLDADDYADNTMYEKMYNHIVDKQSDIIICKSANVDFETKEVSAAKLDYSLRLDLIPRNDDIFNAKDIPQSSFDFSQGFVWDKLFKHDFIEKNNRRFQNIINTNDCYFCFSCLIIADRIYAENIPIILASDNNYAVFMYITMVSILRNSSKETRYDFYLLTPSAFSIENQKMIYGLANRYNCKVLFIDMKDAFSDLKMQISHITSPTYYRLLAGDLLPQYYDKCIYLDVDICVCQDLKQFFDIDLKDNYVGGVVAAGYYFNEEANCKRLKLPSMKTYINAGILLMNLKKIRQDNVTKKFVELSKNNYSSQDQDVINVACYGKILTLPPKYNAMIMRLQQNDPKLLHLYKVEDILEAKTNPVIIHYADKVKPWDNHSIFWAEHWWKIAKLVGYRVGKGIDYRYSLEKWWNSFKPKSLNLDNPRTFNEKIQWLKLYDSTPLKTKLADKYLVRDWVKETIGEEYLISLLGVYDKFEEIDFTKLPNKFVIKCNHGSGYLYQNLPFRHKDW